MTEREALKLALEALERIAYFKLQPDTIQNLTNHYITAIEEVLAQPEPAPVSVKHMMEWVDYLKRKSDYGQHLQIPSEMSAGACWDLARELEQFINTTPPQRTLLGLTDEEIGKIEISDNDLENGFVDLRVISRAIEAKLKEKNT